MKKKLPLLILLACFFISSSFIGPVQTPWRSTGSAVTVLYNANVILEFHSPHHPLRKEYAKNVYITQHAENTIKVKFPGEELKVELYDQNWMNLKPGNTAAAAQVALGQVKNIHATAVLKVSANGKNIECRLKIYSLDGGPTDAEIYIQLR